MWIGDDPTGRATIASATGVAIEGQDTTDVHVENLTLRHYASMVQHGAIQAQQTTGWFVRNVTAQYNHGAGLVAGSGMRLEGGNCSNNGRSASGLRTSPAL